MANRSSSKPQGPSQRQLRVGEQLKHMLADQLTRGDIYHPDLKNSLVTVTEVRCSPDLRHATVFTGVFGTTDAKTKLVLNALNEIATQIQGELGRKMAIKFTPKLKFKEDTVLEEADHINYLFQSDKVKSDVKKGGGSK